MTYGLLVRSDSGGLANQTHSLWSHLKPDKTLLIQLTEPRGLEHNEWYVGDPDLTVLPRGNQITRRQAHEFASGLDTIVSVEGFYGPAFDTTHSELVVVSNPELFANEHRWDRIIVPTPWEISRMPVGTNVIPHPQESPADESFIRERTGTAKVFLHHAAPAMLDRNGTTSLMSALQYVTEKCELIVRAPGKESPDTSDFFEVGNVTVRWDSRNVINWWENYPVETDVFVNPRKYGGLSLPSQEAASCGLPLLMTDLAPQQWWPIEKVKTAVTDKYPMKGGTFNINSPDVQDLAAQMSRLCREDISVNSKASLAWADSLSWENLLPRWKAVCNAG